MDDNKIRNIIIAEKERTRKSLRELNTFIDKLDDNDWINHIINNSYYFWLEQHVLDENLNINDMNREKFNNIIINSIETCNDVATIRKMGWDLLMLIAMIKTTLNS